MRHFKVKVQLGTVLKAYVAGLRFRDWLRWKFIAFGLKTGNYGLHAKKMLYTYPSEIAVLKSKIEIHHITHLGDDNPPSEFALKLDPIDSAIKTVFLEPDAFGLKSDGQPDNMPICHVDPDLIGVKCEPILLIKAFSEHPEPNEIALPTDAELRTLKHEAPGTLETGMETDGYPYIGYFVERDQDDNPAIALPTEGDAILKQVAYLDGANEYAIVTDLDSHLTKTTERAEGTVGVGFDSGIKLFYLEDYDGLTLEELDLYTIGDLYWIITAYATIKYSLHSDGRLTLGMDDGRKDATLGDYSDSTLDDIGDMTLHDWGTARNADAKKGFPNRAEVNEIAFSAAGKADKRLSQAPDGPLSVAIDLGYLDSHTSRTVSIWEANTGIQTDGLDGMLRIAAADEAQTGLEMAGNVTVGKAAERGAFSAGISMNAADCLLARRRTLDDLDAMTLDELDSDTLVDMQYVILS